MLWENYASYGVQEIKSSDKGKIRAGSEGVLFQDGELVFVVILSKNIITPPSPP